MSDVTKKMKILIPCILKTVHYRVYKCTAILHVPMVRAYRENSMSKLDYDAKKVAKYIYRITHVGTGAQGKLSHGLHVENRWVHSAHLSSRLIDHTSKTTVFC